MTLGWKNLGLQVRFMVLAGIGVLTLAAATLALISWFELANLDDKMRTFSENELTSLNTLVESAMEQRLEDSENVTIKVFNRWFDGRNKEYPGKLWSVWSPKVIAYMAETAPERAAKAPLDSIDQEALRTGQPIGRFVDGTYRYSLPIVLGQTLATREGDLQRLPCRRHGPTGWRGDRRVLEQHIDRQGRWRPATASAADGGRHGPRGRDRHPGNPADLRGE